MGEKKSSAYHYSHIKTRTKTPAHTHAHACARAHTHKHTQQEVSSLFRNRLLEEMKAISSKRNSKSSAVTHSSDDDHDFSRSLLLLW